FALVTKKKPNQLICASQLGLSHRIFSPKLTFPLTMAICTHSPYLIRTFFQNHLTLTSPNVLPCSPSNLYQIELSSHHVSMSYVEYQSLYPFHPPLSIVIIRY